MLLCRHQVTKCADYLNSFFRARGLTGTSWFFFSPINLRGCWCGFRVFTSLQVWQWLARYLGLVIGNSFADSSMWYFGRILTEKITLSVTKCVLGGTSRPFILYLGFTILSLMQNIYKYTSGHIYRHISSKYQNSLTWVRCYLNLHYCYWF